MRIAGQRVTTCRSLNEGWTTELGFRRGECYIFGGMLVCKCRERFVRVGFEQLDQWLQVDRGNAYLIYEGKLRWGQAWFSVLRLLH